MIVFGLILAFISGVVITLFVLIISIKNTPSKNIPSKNKVHFYVTRDIDRRLELWIGKPIRIYGKYWIYESEDAVSKITDNKSINNFNLNISDFDNLTYEDEPVEVFLNLKD